MEIKTLTIDPLWVWAIMEGHKTIENRSWFTSYRGPLGIHASKNKSREKETRAWYAEHTELVPPSREELEDTIVGRLVGVTELIDIASIESLPQRHRGPFAEGPYCWLLGSFLPIGQPIETTGKLGLWTYDSQAIIPEPKRQRNETWSTGSLW